MVDYTTIDIELSYDVDPIDIDEVDMYDEDLARLREQYTDYELFSGGY